MSEHSLRALYDLYCCCELARTLHKEKQTWCLYKDHFMVSSEDCASVIFHLKNQTVCFVWKMFVFQRFKVPVGLFVWPENPVKCNVCTLNQKIVTAWFSWNALISTEPLAGISWNLEEY